MEFLCRDGADVRTPLFRPGQPTHLLIERRFFFLVQILHYPTAVLRDGEKRDGRERGLLEFRQDGAKRCVPSRGYFRSWKRK